MSLDLKAWLPGVCLLVLVACGEQRPSPLPEQLPQEASDSLPRTPAPRVLQLVRENEGPYLERTVERFRAVSSSAEVKSVLWSASGGKLETQGLQATWTLPRAGDASLTLTAQTQDGAQLTETYQFRVSAELSSLPEGASGNVPLAPVAVDTSSDTTGFLCDLAFDPAGNGHLIYDRYPHNSLWYGFWNGTTWATQQVDGMGFGTGGVYQGPLALAVDPTGKPHIVYTLGGRGVWYATLSGTTWIRERVDTAALPPAGGTALGIALDPSQGNRPTIAYTFYGLNSNGSYVFQTVLAYRTGAAAWTTSKLAFPMSSSFSNQDFHGELLFDPTGTLFMTVGAFSLGTWKAPSTVAVAEFTTGNDIYSDEHISLARTSAGHVLMRWDGTLLDVTVGTPLSASTARVSFIEPGTSYVGDLIFASGKPQEVHLHGGKLEFVTPGADNYWIYTDLGTAASSTRIALAQRPTTGVVHFCYQSGSKVMFQ